MNWISPTHTGPILTIERFRNFVLENRKIYLLSFLIVFLIVSAFFAIQTLLVIQDFKPQYVIVPALLSLTIGLLLGSVLSLRRALGHHAELFHAIADQASEFSFYRKPSGEFTYVSPAVFTLTGYTPEEFIEDHTLLRRCIHSDDRYLWDNHVHEVDEHFTHNPLLLRVNHKNGSQRLIRHLCKSVTNKDGRVIGVRSTNADVTAEMQALQEVEKLANYDPLTNLPNRRYLIRELETHLQEAKKQKQYFAVLFVDLNRFKFINDSYGHSFGDQLLQSIAARLEPFIQQNIMVCRFGGDEFVVCTPLLTDTKLAEKYAVDILKTLEQPLEIRKKTLYVSASIGISIYPFDGQEPESLIKHADAAMYDSKKAGGRQIQYASNILKSDAQRVLSLETRLRQSLEKQQFLLYFQPKVSLKTGQILGYEALARWQDPVKGLIPPEEFIPIAEETGLIVPISNLLMEQMCQQACRWQQQGLSPTLAFNLSAKQLKDPECCYRIAHRWKQTKLRPEQLEIEITESTIMENFEMVKQQLKYLRQQGIKVCLDDFGTGYSSLGYLRHLPIDTLKIDRSFITKLDQSIQDVQIVKTVITLANNFGMDVIAEGVENEQQSEILKNLGCDMVQGFLYGKPLAAGEQACHSMLH